MSFFGIGNVNNSKANNHIDSNTGLYREDSATWQRFVEMKKAAAAREQEQPLWGTPDSTPANGLSSQESTIPLTIWETEDKSVWDMLNPSGSTPTQAMVSENPFSVLAQTQPLWGETPEETQPTGNTPLWGETPEETQPTGNTPLWGETPEETQPTGNTPLWGEMPEETQPENLRTGIIKQYLDE